MVYIMHVPWKWIKQRPHFIAEEMSKCVDVVGYYYTGYRFGAFVEESAPRNFKPLLRLPLRRLKLFRVLNKWIMGYQLRNVLQECDVVWLTDPLLFLSLEKYLKPNHKVIYDCMDDFLSFSEVKGNLELKKDLELAERKLVSRCGLFISSSSHLMKVMENKYGRFLKKSEKKVVNNGVSNGWMKQGFEKTTRTCVDYEMYKYKNAKLVTYIGTISEWFDMRLILKSLDNQKNLVVLLVGPTDIAIPEHNRLIYLGPVVHDEIRCIMGQSDALIMPFKVTDLIRSVDPVKLYEYICSGKPVVSVEYSETKKFESYAYLYSTQEKYFSLMRMLCDEELPAKILKRDIEKFLDNNSWSSRVLEIFAFLGVGNEECEIL